MRTIKMQYLLLYNIDSEQHYKYFKNEQDMNVFIYNNIIYSLDFKVAAKLEIKDKNYID